MVTQYINVGHIVQSLPESDESWKNSCFHHATIELDVCLAEEVTIESGGTTKVKSCAAVYNIPDTHYVDFRGIRTNIGIFTREGVLKNNSFGFLHVYVHNSSLESHTLPSRMRLGSLKITRYIDFTD